MSDLCKSGRCPMTQVLKTVLPMPDDHQGYRNPLMGISVRDQMSVLFYFTDKISPIPILSPSIIIYKIEKMDNVKTLPGIFTQTEDDPFENYISKTKIPYSPLGVHYHRLIRILETFKDKTKTVSIPIL